MLDERREQALIRVAAYQQRAAKFWNKGVKERHFQVGDWVLRKIFPNTPEHKDGKLNASYEGPYKVVEITGPGAYKLVDVHGKDVPRSWNAIHLKRYYF